VSAGDRARLEAIFRRAVEAADSAAAVRAAVARRPDGALCIAGAEVPREAGLVVLAVGKAAGHMASALEEIAGERIVAGLAVAKDPTPLAHMPLRLAGHPLPDVRSAAAAREALHLVEQAAPGDVLLVLLSGGASSLLSAPAGELRSEDLARTGELLLASGAPIDELNAVRKHLSRVGGGRLALRARARRIEVLAVSDVPGDRLDVLGSGPFCADPTRHADALAVLVRRGLRERVPPAVLAHLEAGARGDEPETAKPGDPRLARVRHTIVANNRTALRGAAEACAAEGLRAVFVTGRLQGEAQVAGRRLARLALSVTSRGRERVCLLAGGETTVTLRDAGRGGRSQELALAAALALAGRPGAALLAAGTDGGDGPTDAAGAFADGDTVARGARGGWDAAAALARHDAYTFFGAEGGLLRTGPTGTNVMDLVLALGGPAT
jgi:glycerate-2-kinase